MYTATAIIIVIVSILLTIVVLIQNSKGGGLAANFASGYQTFGVRKTADLLEKLTWTFAIIIIVLCILATAFISKNKTTDSTMFEPVEMESPMESQPQFPQNPTGNTVDANQVATDAPAAETTPEQN